MTDDASVDIRWRWLAVFAGCCLSAACSPHDAVLPFSNERGDRSAMVYDPLWAAIQTIRCADVAEFLETRYSQGRLSWVPELAQPGFDAQTTFDITIDNVMIKGTDAIEVGDWLMGAEVAVVGDLLVHEYGHTQGVRGHDAGGNTGWEGSCSPIL
jgi:hypothetical protein